MSGALQVAGVCAAMAVVLVAATWGLEGHRVPWSRGAKVGGAYRETEVDGFVVVPRSVQLARAVAWLIVALSVVHALLMFVLTLSREYETSGAYGDPVFSGDAGWSSYFPPDHYFDPVGAALYGFSLIVTGAIVGAFARWAKDAAKDVTQARRPMPIYVAVASAVATVFVKVGLALHQAPGFAGRDRYDWRIATAYVVAVLIGAGFIARARRASR